MNIRYNIKYLTRCIIILLFSEILSSGCGTSKKISNCNILTGTDSTKYYVSGIVNQTEIKSEWLKEKLEKNDVHEWLRNYVNKITSNNNSIDSTSLNKTRENSLNDYLWKWEKIERQITKDENIYYYTTPKIYWKVLAGQDGIVIIKGCKIIYVLILSQS